MQILNIYYFSGLTELVPEAKAMKEKGRVGLEVRVIRNIKKSLKNQIEKRGLMTQNKIFQNEVLFQFNQYIFLTKSCFNYSICELSSNLIHIAFIKKPSFFLVMNTINLEQQTDEFGVQKFSKDTKILLNYTLFYFVLLHSFIWVE